MKHYAKDSAQYHKRFPPQTGRKTIHHKPHTYTRKGRHVTMCTCVFWVWIGNNPSEALTYKDCENCFGHGVQPISWVDLALPLEKVR